MDRREVLSRLGFLFGGAIIGGEAFLAGCSPVDRSSTIALSNSQINLLNDIGEVILPKTTTSEGAKAANVGKFMDTIVSEFYSSDERMVFIEGVQKLEQTSFVSFSEMEKISFVMNLEAEAKNQQENNYYLMIKQLTIWGYMTSEVGMSQMFDFAPVPGRFDPSLNYSVGDKVMNPRLSDWQARNFASFHSRNQS
ncbi:MAG: hypothetical protein BalsKO_30840 [Balneolaceae bacterium]